MHMGTREVLGAGAVVGGGIVAVEVWGGRRYSFGEHVIFQTPGDCVEGVITQVSPRHPIGGVYYDYVVLAKNGRYVGAQESELAPFSEAALEQCRDEAVQGVPMGERLKNLIEEHPGETLAFLVALVLAWGFLTRWRFIPG